MKKQKQQGIKKRLTKGFVKAAVIGAIAAMIGVVALLIAASQYEKALNRYGFTRKRTISSTLTNICRSHG